MGRYELFLDESGSFLETSLDPREQAKASAQAYQFPSQLAGLLARAGVLSPARAAATLAAVRAAIGAPAGVELHGTELPREDLQRALEVVVGDCRVTGVQPVRLVNRERVTFGDKSAIYTQMVAELVLQICSVLARRGEAEVEIAITAAKVYLDPEEPGERPRVLPADRYKQQVWMTIGFEAVHRGYAAAAAHWRLATLTLTSPKDDGRLQLCDLISNASKDNFKRLTAAQAESLQASLGDFDFTLAILPTVQAVDRLIEDGALGLAVCAIAQRLHSPKDALGGVRADLPPAGERTRRQLGERLGQVRHRLAAMEAPARSAHLEAVLSWLNQLVESRRTLAAGLKVAEWLDEEVAVPLGDLLPSGATGLAWFRYACQRWRLTGANHSGELPLAANALATLERIAPQLAGRWEHAPLLFEGWVAGAVHLIDRWEHEAAARRMRAVDEYYGGLGALFADALPELFPAEIRSDMRARALGTWVQAELARGATDDERWPVARELSRRAIAEFATDDDRRRQYQYRCHLESEMGCYREAQQFLGASVGAAPDATLTEIGARIAAIDPDRQGFPLLHWMRHCAIRAARGGAGERETVRDALVRTRLLTATPWTQSTSAALRYPRPGILRYAAALSVALGDRRSALGMLSLLRREIDPRRDPIALVPLLAAALTEVAAGCLDDDPGTARLLLSCGDAKRLGAEQVIEQLMTRARAHGFGAMAEALGQWRSTIRDLAQRGNASGTSSAALLARARQVIH